VLGLFVASVAVSFLSHRAEGIVGVMIMAVGAGAIWFSRTLIEVQQELAEHPYIPSHWREVRPLTFVLWGIVGLAKVFIW